MRSAASISHSNERPRNADRARWAASAVAKFAKATGMGTDLGADPETVLVDLLADLMHWCDARVLTRSDDAALDFGSALARARSHYLAEFPSEYRSKAAQRIAR